jgi:hypothetical protein
MNRSHPKARSLRPDETVDVDIDACEILFAVMGLLPGMTERRPT